MNESYINFEDPWFDETTESIEYILAFMWLMNQYLNNTCDTLNDAVSGKNIDKIDSRALRQEWIKRKPNIKLLPPPIHEDLRLTKLKFGL